MLQVKIGRNVVNFGLIVVDMQNGFVSSEGSYGKLGMNIENYQKVIPKIKELINFCRNEKIPIFYTEAIREPSGIDLLLNVHNILPRTREERLQRRIYQFVYEEHGMHKQLMKLNQQKKII